MKMLLRDDAEEFEFAGAWRLGRPELNVNRLPGQLWVVRDEPARGRVVKIGIELGLKDRKCAPRIAPGLVVHHDEQRLITGRVVRHEVDSAIGSQGHEGSR